MAALDAGAHHVIGVEGRPELVDARANEWRRLIDSICDQVSCIDAAVRVKAASLNQPPPVKSSRG